MHKTNKLTNYHRILYILNFIGLLALLIVNFLANTLPINGQTTAEISAKYQNLFTPAGFTFFIWSVIYTGLVVYLLYQFRAIKGSKDPKEPSGYVTAQLGLTFLVSCIANLSWVIAWHYEQLTLTIILMALLLLSLIDINRRIYRISEQSRTLPKYFNWCVKAPFGLYLGWISIAIIANISVYLTAQGWEGFGVPESIWTIFFVIFGALIALYLLSQMQQYAAAVAIAWGFLGLLFKYWQSDSNTAIQVTSLLMLALLGIGIARTYRRNNLRKSKIQLQ